MITDERQALAAVDAALDGFLAERISRASTAGPSYRRLWERIGLACSGGKRIRPRLLLLAHNALGGDAHDDAVAASLAFELLHTAFLLHDAVRATLTGRVDGPEVKALSGAQSACTERAERG